MCHIHTFGPLCLFSRPNLPPAEAPGDEEALGDLLLEVLPADGASLGNQAAREALGQATAGREIGEEAYEEVREHLLKLGLIRKGSCRDAREKRPACGEKGPPRLGLQCGALAQRRQLAPHDQALPQALHIPPDQELGAIQVVLTLVESLSEEMVETPARASPDPDPFSSQQHPGMTRDVVAWRR